MKRRNQHGKTVNVQVVAWNSQEYWAGIALRNQLLKASAGEPAIQALPLDEQAALHVVAKVSEQVVGTLMIVAKERGLARFKQIAVSPATQGLGVGKQLVEEAERLCSTMGFTEVFLTGRSQAWGFYEHLGYQVIGPAYQEGQLLFKYFEKAISQPQKTARVLSYA